jgi:two-component system, NtrC family, nitrogen regulation sensor histidine kinase NtrY
LDLSGEAVSFRRKLLLVFSVTVLVSVAVVAWIISTFVRRSFDRLNEARTAALVAQFHREFVNRGEDIARRVAAIASSESALRVALTLNRGAPDYAPFLSEAKTLAENQQLDFLELLDDRGMIISSAQSPARYGYKDTTIQLERGTLKSPFLKREDLSDGPALGLFAIRAVNIGEKPLFVVGGRKLNAEFVVSLELPTGMHTLLYPSLESGFSPKLLIDPTKSVPQPQRLQSLIEKSKNVGDSRELVSWSRDPADSELLSAFPLKGEDGQVLGILLVGNSQRPYVELERRIRFVTLLVGGSAIVIAIILSTWMAARITRPVERLAAAAQEVASGNWNTQVELDSDDELGQFADSFNQMTRQLIQQREHLVQTERVAAWRELARRLAHELKNPLFPLQITVENLLRARQHSPRMFDEIFQESTSTLLTEIQNLKSIIARFSEFSKMPAPQFQRTSVNAVIDGVIRLFQAQFTAGDRPRVVPQLDLQLDLPIIAADPDLLHRAFSNLILNAMDAMPQGGIVCVRTCAFDGRVQVELSDSGIGLKEEERDRLFTPYYTSKTHGTGLGLAIVQSVISDHDGRITVESAPGKGTCFRIELPSNLDKLSENKTHEESAHTTN